MESPRDDQLSADLRALRPTPRPQFAAELDERAAAGFPRRTRVPRLSFALPRLSPRRLLLPASGVALATIAIATAVVAFQEKDDEPARGGLLSYAAGEGESVTKHPERLGKSSSPASEGKVEVPSAEIQKHQRARATESSSAGSVTFSADAGLADANANFNPDRRSVERSAQIVLAAEPGDVPEDSRKVFEAVHAHDGIVMRSSTSAGAPDEAGARFELLIPSAKLRDALAALSAIDEVRFRHEATADITAPTVNLAELLQDSRARIDSLLAQLEAADTESEREAVEAELRQERRHRALLRSQLQQLERRAQFSRVTVRIETGAADESSGAGAWGVGDALDDAGRLLTIAAAVTLIALAVIAPIVLIALLAWLTHRAWVRRERRRVLG